MSHHPLSTNEETLTFYGGLTTIGGVHIVYACGSTALVFDLGLGLSRAYFSADLRVAPDDGIRSYLLTRLAPPVLGLYDPDCLGELSEAQLAKVWNADGLPAYRELHAFVSHIHQDHMALLPALRTGLPVYMHRDAIAVYEGIIAAGEFADTAADLRPVDDGQVVDFGPFQVEFIEVDHDTPGVTGFIIHGPSHKIAFTADWRRHGRHPYRMDQFIERCRAARVDVLITEGTRLRPDTLFRKPKDRLEVEVAEACRQAMEETSGLVYVNVLARNVERVADLILAAQEAGRHLVMDESTAALWHRSAPRIAALEHHPALDADREIIRVMATPSWSQGPRPTFGSEALPYERVTTEEITARKGSYAVYLTYAHTPYLAELETAGVPAEQASIYVHADGNPLTSSDELLLRWLNDFGVEYRYRATGGHASPQEISELAARIQPEVVIPLHSMHPTLIHCPGIRKVFPAPGEQVSLPQLVKKPIEIQ